MHHQSAQFRETAIRLVAGRFQRMAMTVAVAALAVSLTSLPVLAQAGIQSGPAAVNVNAAKNASLTLTVISGATQSLASITDNAVNEFPTPVSFTTTWDVHPQTDGFIVVASFASAANALAHSETADAIASSFIEGSVPTGQPVTFTPFTADVTGGTPGAGLLLVQQSLTPPTRRGSRTDNLSLRLNLVGADPVAVGEYSGVLTLRAITQ
ncbi:MAG TPA: hypothetical protein VKZ41_11095 [Gemmatimonadales bacterium]|nr:hypothetical protein [Gemmatimonadales bacterium]